MSSAITVVLDPHLHLPAHELAEAWNRDATLVATAQLTPAPPDPTTFDPALTDLALLVLGNVGLGLLTSALYDGIKMVLARRTAPSAAAPHDPPPPFAIRTVTLPDGAVLLLVEPVETPQ